MTPSALNKLFSKRFFIVEGSPLTRDSRHETFSYLSSETIERGSVITVPLRGKERPFLVLDSKDARSLKLSVRKSSFALKRISNPQALFALPTETVTALTRTAEEHITSPGTILNYLLPSILLKTGVNIRKSEIKSTDTAKQFEELILVATEEEIVKEYKRIIRESFALEKSILIIVPDKHSFNSLREKLSKGIEDRIIGLSGALSTKEQRQALETSVENPKPLCVIATPGFMLAPMREWRMVILHNEHSPHYKQGRRPFTDLRFFIQTYCEEHGLPLLYGSPTPSLETFNRYMRKEIKPLVRPTTRFYFDAETHLVDMKKYRGKDFRVLSDEVLVHLGDTLASGKRAFVLAPRLGLYPITACDDCGSTVTCTRCNYPLTLTEEKGSRIYVCKLCAAEYETGTRCPSCNSWRLTLLGIGIENVEEVLKTNFPDTPLWTVSSDATPTASSQQKTINEFEQAGGILLATQLALPYFSPVNLSVIVSVDPLLTIPDISIQEEIFRLIFAIAEKTEDRLFLQTRSAETEILTEALEGRYDQFSERELARREELELPPFVRFVAVRRTGALSILRTSAKELYETFKEFKPNLYPLRPSSVRRASGLQMLVVVPEKKDEKKKLFLKLSELPMIYEIDTKPKNLFL